MLGLEAVDELRIALAVCAVAFMHRFCIGMYIAFVRGLYAPAGQFLPPFVPGHTMSV